MPFKKNPLWELRVKLFSVFLVLLHSPFVLFSQTPSVSGKVLSELKVPIPSVSVSVKGKSVTTQTNELGKFTIPASVGETLVFTSVGYESHELKVSNAGDVEVSLKRKTTEMSDVVVVGYGSQRKKDITSAVSSVTAKDFKDQPVTSVAQVLQGRAAGVQVMSNAGSPGGDVSIRIRGSNSIKGNNNPLYVIDGFVGADYNTINPADIASIEVLKDASATAIYGSRGANGVVLITTKRGKSGAPQIEFSSRFTASQVLKQMKLLNAADFAFTANENAAAFGVAPFFTQAQIDEFKEKGGTDWQDEVFRTAPTQEYQLSVSGGSEKTSYYIGANHLDQEGIVINSYYKRSSLRTNLNTQLSKKFALYMNAYAARQERNNVVGNDGRWSAVTQAIAWSPTIPVRDAHGKFIVNDLFSSVTESPVALMMDRIRNNFNTTGNALIGLKYNIANGLTLDVSGAANYGNTQGLNFADASVSQNAPSASRSSLESISLQNTNNLTYTHLFNDVHRLTATAVMEVQKFESNGFNAAGNNLIFPELGYYNLSQAATYAVGTSYTDYGLLSYLGRVNYAYKDKYLLSASLRRDGSSKFQKGNQYSAFPSIGLGWKISDEDFVKNLGIINNLKFRVGYGVTGSQAIDPYQSLTAYSNVSTAFTSGTLTPGIILGNPGNPNLKWESTEQYDIGLDADLLKNRLSFSFDYFIKHTNDLMLDEPVPAYLGGGSVLSNVGAMDNSGYEFSLSGVPVSGNAFKWTSSFNLTLLTNKVVSLTKETDKLFTKSNVGAGLSSQPEFVLIPGQSMGAYWGLTYLGTWKPADKDLAAKYGNVPGDSRYLDLNGDFKIDGTDYHVMGNGLPRYSWGWNNTVNYKSFTLNLFVQSVGGYDKLNYLYGAGITTSGDIRQAMFEDIKNRYIPGKNETSDIPAFSKTTKSYIQSTRFMEDGSFIRLKNISLSYDLPRAMLKKLDMKLFVSGANLVTISKYSGFDPESTSTTSGAGADINQSIDYGSYPNAKSITAGVTLKF